MVQGWGATLRCAVQWVGWGGCALSPEEAEQSMCYQHMVCAQRSLKCAMGILLMISESKFHLVPHEIANAVPPKEQHVRARCALERGS